MHSTTRWTLAVAASSLTVLGCMSGPAQREGGASQMSFFVTSVNPGKGGDLGGLAGADAHCQSLAAAAGAGKRTWRAYLSTQGRELGDKGVIHARDRIGTGPWYNARGVRIAQNLADLHSGRNNVTKETALDERGRMVNGRTEKPNRHDILTGSRPDGTARPPSGRFGDMTCSNWTYGGDKGAAMARVPAELIDAVALVGPRERVRERLSIWRGSPVTTLNMTVFDVETLRTMVELVGEVT